jgi:hypothetical protein
MANHRATRVLTIPGVLARALLLVVALAPNALAGPAAAQPADPPMMLFAIGDSLGQGTMDATNNYWATANAFLGRVFYQLGTVRKTYFSQPYYDFQENRIFPLTVPTNVSVDGADVFSIEGLEYGKRVGSTVNERSSSLLADQLPSAFQDDYDKVLYPTDAATHRPMSQVDAALWLVNQWAPRLGIHQALCVLWIGNNDSSTAALGRGGANPSFLPVPLYQIAPAVDPLLFWLMFFGAVSGNASFAPYTPAAIDRNLTSIDDFTAQYDAVLTRMQAETAASGVDVDTFVLTLPYYSAVGYLFDSDDLEFYLRKLDPSYSVPPSFRRVRLPGEPLSGDRVSLLTFGFMYALLATGYSSSYVNSILEQSGVQQDGLVLSETEQQTIMSRIDEFNAAIRSLAANHGSKFHVIDIGEHINDAFLGNVPVHVNGRTLNRKWVRGGGFTFDGVHPDPTGQSFIANYVLEKIGTELGIAAPFYDLSTVATKDPYWDVDADGWASGPPWDAAGITALLHLFRDADDRSPSVGVTLPADVWHRISQVLLGELVKTPAMAAQAAKMGLR